MYLTGKLLLKSNVTLHVAAGATLLGAEACENYPETENVKHVDSAKLPRLRNTCLIFADECENIGLTGDGTIDCNGDKYVVPRTGEIKGWPYKRIDAPTPPRVVFFTGCRNVMVEDITMVNQPAGWSYWIHDCDFVTFDKVKIIANVEYPNNDGIHIRIPKGKGIIAKIGRWLIYILIKEVESMDLLKKYWPTPFKIKEKDITSFVVQLIIFVVACAVVGILIGVLASIPIIGIIFGILGAVVEIYGIVGIVLCILQFLGILK